jgi:chromosome segregation ATPase
MARRQAIEADEFFETANRLKAEGKKVTAELMLGALGGGSYRTMYKFMDLWEASQPAEKKALAADDIPPSVVAAYASAWRVASQAAEQQIQLVKDSAAEEITKAVKQFDDALGSIDKLEAENEANTILIDELRAKLAESESLAQTTRSESAGHQAAAALLQKQVEKLERDLERARTDAGKIQEKHEEALRKIESRLEITEESLKNAQANAAKFETQSKEMTALRNQNVEAREAAEKASQADRAERDSAIKEAAELKGQLESLKGQNQELLDKLLK